MPTPAILNPTKVIFLDIDGVLQCDRQDRFDHLRDGSFERLITEVRERCGYTDSAFDYLAKPLPNTYRYDFLAAAFDWEIDAIERLKKLITKHNAAIVLSTSWRLIGCRGMLLILGLYGLDKYLSGTTLLETHFYDWDKDKLIDEHGSYEFSRKFTEHIEKALIKNSDRDYVGSRACEICAYLAHHPEIKSFVALDDINLVRDLAGYAVRTPGRFTEESLAEADAILSKIADRSFLDPLNDPELKAEINEALTFNDKVFWD